MPDELSDDTIDKLKSLKRYAEEIMRVMGVPEDRAWQMMAACNVERVAMIAAKIDKRAGDRCGETLFSGDGGDIQGKGGGIDNDTR